MNTWPTRLLAVAVAAGFGLIPALFLRPRPVAIITGMFVASVVLTLIDHWMSKAQRAKEPDTLAGSATGKPGGEEAK